MVAAAPENSEEKENLKKKFELSGEECQLAQERMEHMKQWESQKPVNVASGIVRVRTVNYSKKRQNFAIDGSGRKCTEMTHLTLIVI